MLWGSFILSCLLVYTFHIYTCINFPNRNLRKISGCERKICYSNNKNPYRYFASKTSYLIHGIGNEYTDEIQLPGMMKLCRN